MGSSTLRPAGEDALAAYDELRDERRSFTENCRQCSDYLAPDWGAAADHIGDGLPLNCSPDCSATACIQIEGSSITDLALRQSCAKRVFHNLTPKFQLMLIRDERRLSDVLHDWAVQNSDLLSVQRLKNLETDYPAPIQGPLTHRLSWFAMVALDEGKDSRWKSLAQARSERAAIAPHAHGQQDESLTVIEPAAHARAAYPSGDVFAKLRGVRARLTPDAALLLRLRLGFGVGLKADVVGFLLTRVDDWATVRDITDALGYTVAAVRRVAEDMAAARLIESRDGQPASYRTAVDAWKSLLRFTDRPPRWASWQERFVFATSFLHWAEEIGDRPLSAYAFGAQGRHILEQHRSAFEHDGIAVWSAHAPVKDWGAFAAASVRSLAAWIEENG